MVAAQLHAGYDRAKRIRLLDVAFERVEELLDEVNDARTLQQLVAALATLVDRRRTEESEPTARTEMIDREAARVSLAVKLDALVARRANG